MQIFQYLCLRQVWYGTGTERVRNGCGTGKDQVRNGYGTGTERARNGYGTGTERERNGHGTGAERARNGHGTVVEFPAFFPRISVFSRIPGCFLSNFMFF